MIRYKTKVDIVYDMILEGIAGGRYKHGDRLVIRQIASACKVSETPVREAIRRMESKGFATVTPSHGAVVSSMSPETLHGIFQIKGVLEGFATRLSIDHISPGQLRELREINDRLRRAAARRDPEENGRLNMEFHLAIYRCLPQTELYNMIVDLWERWSITRSVFSAVPGHADDSVSEHEEILRLIECREGDRVEAYVREHKFRAGFALSNRIRE